MMSEKQDQTEELGSWYFVENAHHDYCVPQSDLIVVDSKLVVVGDTVNFLYFSRRFSGVVKMVSDNEDEVLDSIKAAKAERSSKGKGPKSSQLPSSRLRSSAKTSTVKEDDAAVETKRQKRAKEAALKKKLKSRASIVMERELSEDANNSQPSLPGKAVSVNLQKCVEESNDSDSSGSSSDGSSSGSSVESVADRTVKLRNSKDVKTLNTLSKAQPCDGSKLGTEEKSLNSGGIKPASDTSINKKKKKCKDSEQDKFIDTLAQEEVRQQGPAGQGEIISLELSDKTQKRNKRSKSKDKMQEKFVGTSAQYKVGHLDPAQQGEKNSLGSSDETRKKKKRSKSKDKMQEKFIDTSAQCKVGHLDPAQQGEKNSLGSSDETRKKKKRNKSKDKMQEKVVTKTCVGQQGLSEQRKKSEDENFNDIREGRFEDLRPLACERVDSNPMPLHECTSKELSNNLPQTEQLDWSDSEDSDTSSSGSSSSGTSSSGSSSNRSPSPKRSKTKIKRNLTIYPGVNFRFSEDDQNVVKLHDDFEVYVLKSDMDALKKLRSQSLFVQHALEKVYTLDALLKSTPTGTPPRGKGSDFYKDGKLPPRLHPDGIDAILRKCVELELSNKRWRPKLPESALMSKISNKCSQIKTAHKTSQPKKSN